MRTKVRITHFAVLGCVFTYSVERPGEEARPGKITATDLEALVAKVGKSEGVTTIQGLLATIHQSCFQGLCSGLVHKHAMIDYGSGKLYINGDRVNEDSGYGFLTIAEPDSQIDDMVAASKALEEQRTQDAKHYQELRNLMTEHGWIQRSTGNWANFKTVISDQPTMHDAIKAMIQAGHGK
jgi:hypothetical protein